MRIRLSIDDVSKNEAARALSYLPEGHPVTVTRRKTTVGGRRFEIDAENLSIEEVDRITHALFGYMDAVSKGQTS